MADVKLNPVFEGISKKIGDLVFMRKNGKTFIRRKGDATTTQTEAQVRVRSIFSNTVDTWKEMEEWMQELWDRAAKGSGMSGYNLFMKRSMVLLLGDEKPELVPEEADVQAFEFTAEGGGSGGISCTVPGTAVQEDGSLLLYIQEADNGKTERYADSISSGIAFSLTGLTPGADYYLHFIAVSGTEGNLQITGYAVQKVTASS